MLSQLSMVQLTEGAVGASGDMTQRNTKHGQAPMIQHKGGAEGGRGAATPSNTKTSTNLSQPSMVQHKGGAEGGRGAATPSNTHIIQPAMSKNKRKAVFENKREDTFQNKRRAVGGLGDMTQRNTEHGQAPMVQHTKGAVGGRGAATMRNTQANADLSQPSMVQHKGGAEGGSGDIDQITSMLSQLSMVQLTEGAVGASGDMTQRNTKHGQAPMIQHKGGAEGGRGAATPRNTQRNTDLSQPSRKQDKGGAVGGSADIDQITSMLSQLSIVQLTEGAVGGQGAATPRNTHFIQPAMLKNKRRAVFEKKSRAVGGSGDAPPTDRKLSQPPMMLHEAGAVGRSGHSTPTNTSLSQPSVLQNTTGSGAGWGGTTATKTDLSQVPVIQRTEGAEKGLGDATLTDTDLNQAAVIQHTGGDGGRVVRARRNTNLLQPATLQHEGGSAGGRGAPAAVVQPPALPKSSSGGSRDAAGLSGACGVGAAGKKGAASLQKASSALSGANPAGDYRDEQQRLVDWVAEDMATWESSGQWMFSCYCPEKGKPNVSDFPEISFEELHLGYYICRAKKGTGLYINAVHQYVQQWRTRLQKLKVLNAWRTASMLLWREKADTEPLLFLVLGGQQAPSPGFPSSPANSRSPSVPSAASLHAPGAAAGRGLWGFRALGARLLQTLPAPLRLLSLLPRQLQRLLSREQAALRPHRQPVPLDTAPRPRLCIPTASEQAALRTEEGTEGRRAGAAKGQEDQARKDP
ncbi:uncharacterized protein LOC128079445 isoform X3 [Tympanuchus pallidicinctus]|uniref:uncharacterized protein LOC128079445 isoform X3 n=1 Tax=Tympanuchus pallidicinctus TaxID=109042 RepID=UPI0022871B84|nr:uncharacterized protein LOC128079445 isoform X3 [Tympanuchus pallidicinctus]XP_052536630.1 uncharacterized protein LOC128079445 isoform X3 [Tympanuchus pallidicinctus]